MKTKRYDFFTKNSYNKCTALNEGINLEVCSKSKMTFKTPRVYIHADLKVCDKTDSHVII